MKGRQLRKLRRELIEDMALDRTASTKDVCIRLCDVVGTRLRRQIQLRFEDMDANGLTGAWTRTADGVDIISVTTARSWVHRLHILLHELAHMICDHQSPQLTKQESEQLLYPDIFPGMLTKLAERTEWSREHEHEAEHVAGVLLRGLLKWANEHQVDPFVPAGDDGATRVWYALGYTPGRGASGS
ncbi:hypothetical protein [Crossiella cryophila]|uniref:IrrE N-terminal-like domain-containing protein n=1 Tax=Crossiella cryophila TaxID=43355 RepID=A0A7W7CEG8_9PSEU|nr:hypothetical protein [Crossiella cryophila]MBB4679517.1 hypothetical protein [Crossiella cryophila]